MIVLQEGTTNMFFKRSFAKQAPEDMNALQETRGKPTEDLILISLDPQDPKKATYIGASLQGPLKENLKKFLQESNIVFAWNAIDIPGIDPQLITHTLNVDSLRKPIK